MSEVVELRWDDRPVRIEHRFIHGPGDGPLLVFLHEGLGSLAMWKDFPDRLCAACGARGLVYSRPGFGRSTPRPPDRPLQPDFMHRQACELLPALLAALHIDEPVVPLGHSDGGSIALLYAARFPEHVRGLVVLAPHIVVEAISLASIGAAPALWATTELPRKLARYHDDAATVFQGWVDIWLRPDFAAWTIETELDTIRCPVLAIQGLDDEYGTLAQIRGIAHRVPGTRLLELANCGHSPHRDQPEAVIEAVGSFLKLL